MEEATLDRRQQASGRAVAQPLQGLCPSPGVFGERAGEEDWFSVSGNLIAWSWGSSPLIPANHVS